MDSYRSDRFLGVLSSSSPSSSSSASFELDEHDIFSTDTDPNPNPNPNLSPKPNPRKSPLSPFYRDRGILAALPEEDRNPNFFHQSSSSSARMIPVAPRPRAAGAGRYQSAPVNVPVNPRRLKETLGERDDDDGDDEDDAEMMMPPHEIAERAQGKDEPLMTFSVLEGVGRTLKGRDLRRVRNAVWRKTDHSSKLKQDHHCHHHIGLHRTK